MCGVSGIIDFNCRENSRKNVESMLRSIVYRGPDESGIYQSPYATLGNVRLSIVDIEGGQQPLSDLSGRFWIVFNGEIFNYKELRSDLDKKGYIFKTKCDTEVLVQLYAIHGPDCLGLLNGQFSFAIWDKSREELFLARDRVGIRPLFYNIHNGIFSFASEIKALFQLNYIDREFNNESLSQVYSYWTTITPKTTFKNIFEVPPGHYAIYNRKGLTIKKFWELNYNKPEITPSFQDAIEHFNELFSDSVRIRLRADVEVAAYLSGGIDSSATVAYIKNIEPGILNTFSIGFDEKDFDESPYQREAAEYFGTTHKSMICTSKDISDSFPKVIWHSETPILRTAPAPMLMLSELVRKNNIKVVVTGEGSDEILAGYDIFKEAIIKRFWASQPDSKIRPLLLKKLYPYLSQMKDVNPRMLRMFYGYKLEDVNNPFYSHLLRWNNSNHIKKHFSDKLKHDLTGYSYLADLENRLPDNFDTWDQLAKSQWLETTVFMSGYLLSSQGDRMGMANSVEGRYPFLDYRVIEFCSSLPSEYKLRGLNEKYLLKKLLKNKIPESILNRPKQAYRAPIKNAFLSKEKPEYVKHMLSEESFTKSGIFNFETISGLVSKIENTGVSSEIDNMILSSVISTHLLYYQFIENKNDEFRHGELRKLKIINETQLDETYKSKQI
jgi:asparagine synthase (glutamine-hydrolysing)